MDKWSFYFIKFKFTGICCFKEIKNSQKRSFTGTGRSKNNNYITLFYC